jgi:cell division septal protein FtsQ
LSYLKAAAWIVFLLLVAEIIYAAVASPRFAVREVVLRGDPAVIQQLAPNLRLPPDTNLFRAPKELLEGQAQSVPAVRRAQVRRHPPDRLVVAVERREAAAVVRRPDRAVLVDPGGVLFSVPGEWGWGMPELMLSDPAPTTGPSLKGEAAILLDVVRTLTPDPRLRVVRLRFTAPNEVEVVLQSGPKVNLGHPDELEAKLDLLLSALDELGAQNVEYMDLRDPDSAFWRPRDAAVLSPVR